MVTTATVTGASYGYALMWAIVFSIVATIILQETSIRLGLGARLSTGEALRATFASPIPQVLMAVLVIADIGIGGAAYAGGDTTGTSLALNSVTGLPVPVLFRRRRRRGAAASSFRKLQAAKDRNDGARYCARVRVRRHGRERALHCYAHRARGGAAFRRRADRHDGRSLKRVPALQPRAGEVG